MNGRSSQHALDRIESAIARIERAAASLSDDTARQKARHELLREAVSQSLGDLDALLAARPEGEAL